MSADALTGKIKCPGCRKNVDVKNLFNTRTVLCRACKTVLIVRSGKPTITQKSIVENAKSPLSVGMHGTLNEGKVEIIGRVRYSDGEGKEWDEWLILAEGNQYLVLREEDWRFTILKTFAPVKEPGLSGDLKVVDFDGKSRPVEGMDAGSVKCMEGELTWRASVGSEITSLRARKDADTVYFAEWTKEEKMFYKGRAISVKDLYKVFNIRENIPPEALKKMTGEAEPSVSRVAENPYFKYTLVFGFLCLAAGIVFTILAIHIMPHLATILLILGGVLVVLSIVMAVLTLLYGKGKI